MSYTQQITAFDNERTYPWVRAGNNIGGTDTLTGALEASGLANWNVEKKELFTSDADRVSSHYAVVRNDKASVLGVVGRRYRVHQNEEAFAPVQDILDTSDLQPETAGMKNGGQQVFLSLKIPEGINIAGEDSHAARLLAVTSHDGSLATTFAIMVGRLACFNALRPSLNTPRKFSIRHTTHSHLRINEARDVLGLTFDYVDEFSEQMGRWLDSPLSDTKFEVVTHKILPIREGLSEGRVAAIQDRRATLFDLYKNSPTNEFGRGTKYAAYNALNEYSNWFLPMKNGSDEKRALRTLDDDSIVAKFDARAQRVLAAI